MSPSDTAPGLQQRARARPDRGRVRAHLREARPRAQRGRARDVLAAVERALLLQALQEAARDAADRGRARRHGPGRERGRRRRRRRPGASRSRSSRTTTRAPSSRSRARRPASAASCATSSRSARARSPCSTRCASASPPARARGTCSTTPSPGSAHYGNSIGVRDGRRRGLPRGPVRAELPRQRDGARPRATRTGMIRSAAAGVGNVVVLFGVLDRPRRHRRRVGAGQRGARQTRTSARRCRSATRSRTRSCSSARWSCSSAGCSSRCRTSAPRG